MQHVAHDNYAAVEDGTLGSRGVAYQRHWRVVSLLELLQHELTQVACKSKPSRSMRSH